MKLDRTQVEHVARLARLAVSEEEKEALSRQLSSILSYIGKLNELDTSRIEPTSHVLDLKNVVREDAVRPGLTPDEALSNAPDREGDHFRVPKIIEERH